MVVRSSVIFRLIFVVLMGTSNAYAQSDALDTEFTIFGGLRTGGEFSGEDSDVSYKARDASSYGLIWNKRQSGNTEWEVYFSQQDLEVQQNDPLLTLPDLDVDMYTLQIGGTYLFDGNGTRPFLSMTLGGSHMKVDSDTGESDTFVSGSIGMGLKFREGERLGFRLEGRVHGVFVSSNTDLFCYTGPEGSVCAVQIEGSMFSQFEALAGVTFRF